MLQAKNKKQQKPHSFVWPSGAAKNGCEKRMTSCICEDKLRNQTCSVCSFPSCAVAASSRLQLTAAEGAKAPLHIITCTQCWGGKFSNLFSGKARDTQAIRVFLLLFLALALHLSSTKLTRRKLVPWVRSESHKTLLRIFAYEICESWKRCARHAVIISPVITT